MAGTKPLARGEGTITQLSNGTWRGRVLVNGRRESVTCATREELKALLRELRATDGLPPASDAPTLGEWCAIWLADYTPEGVSGNALAAYRWSLSRFDSLAAVPMDTLETAQIEGRLRQLAGGGMSRRSLTIARGHLGMAIDAYTAPRRISWNPARAVRIPKAAATADERRALSAEQARAFVAAARGGPHEAALVLMVYLGLRPGEACGLPWSAVDLDAGTLDVVQFRRVTRAPGRSSVVTMAGPKARSDRRLALPLPVVAALRRRQAAQAAERLAAPTWADYGLVVTTSSGRPLDAANLRRRVRLVGKAAGIDWSPALRPYELRHTAASLLVESGLALEEVADLLGHSVEVLIDHYRHRSKRVVSAHVDIMAGMLG